MFARLFGGNSSKSAGPAPSGGGRQGQASVTNAHQTLADTEEMLEKKAAYLEKQMDEELTKAKQLQAAGKKNQALMCMKKRKLLDTQHGQILSQIMLLFTQRNGLDSMNMQNLVVKNVEDAHRLQKAQLQKLDANKAAELMDDIAEANDEINAINEAMAQHTGMGLAADDDELMGELEQHMAADQEAQLAELTAPVSAGKLPAQAAKAPAAPAAAAAGALPSVPARPVPQAAPKKSKVDQELEEMMAELA